MNIPNATVVLSYNNLNNDEDQTRHGKGNLYKSISFGSLTGLVKRLYNIFSGKTPSYTQEEQYVAGAIKYIIKSAYALEKHNMEIIKSP